MKNLTEVGITHEVPQNYAQNLKLVVPLSTIFMKVMKKSIFLLVLLFLKLNVVEAQEATTTQTVLKLPVSSHAAALGGENISVIEDTPWAGVANPALYASVSDKSLGLDFMTYPSGGTWMGAQFVKAFGERHTAAFTAQYMNYGTMDETDEMGTVIGAFSPKDILLGGAYSYLLSDRWAGGAALRALSSNYGGYSALSVAVDLGLNYLDEETDLSVSVALRNIGAQIASFDGRTEKLPFTAQVGFTKGMAHMPVRLSVTLTDLTRWSSDDYFTPEGEELSFGKKFLNHFVVGVDILASESIYLSAGYNFRRAYELKAAGAGHGAGLSFGAGVNLKRFKFSASYAKYHLAASSLMFNVGYVL